MFFFPPILWFKNFVKKFQKKKKISWNYTTKQKFPNICVKKWKKLLTKTTWPYNPLKPFKIGYVKLWFDKQCFFTPDSKSYLFASRIGIGSTLLINMVGVKIWPWKKGKVNRIQTSRKAKNPKNTPNFCPKRKSPLK